MIFSGPETVAVNKEGYEMSRVFGHLGNYELLRFLIAYLITGISLVGYDFKTPPLHQKIYVLNKNIVFAISNWFLWPVFSVKDAWVEQLLRRRGIRYALGVVVLFISLFVVSGLLLQFFAWFTGSAYASVIMAFFVTLFLCPFATAITMPGWE